MHHTTSTRIYAELNTLALLSKFIIGGIGVNSIVTGSAILKWVKRLKKNVLQSYIIFHLITECSLIYPHVNFLSSHRPHRV